MPENNKLTHQKLVDVAYSWVMKRCGFALKELVTIISEVPDVIGFNSGETFLIECKATRSDFLADKKKMFRVHPSMGMGKFRYYLCPQGLISIEELPENWGLIYVNEKGKSECVHSPSGKGNIYSRWKGFDERNKEGEAQMMYSALRRLQLNGGISSVYSNLKREENPNNLKLN